MNIAEALSELKITRTRIARAIESREKTIKYKGKKPNKTYEQLTKDIKDYAKKATSLKLKILKANVNTIVGKKVLQEIILEQADIRSEIASLKGILGKGKKRYHEDIFSESYDKEKFQVNRFDVEEDIKKLESEKRKIDSVIQSTNWKTKLI